ncbi:MAG: Bug family tripartite tricarboxylate transporter substrate binding protein [Betaproteobacteria bacterium]
MMSRAWILVLAGAFSVLSPLTGSAQSYPTRPVKFVVASTGSPQDVIGRLFAQKIQENWGQPIVVEIRAGAGALISIQTVAKAPPDGYTILVSSTAFAVTPWMYPQHGYDSVKDFVPIGLLATAPTVLVPSASSGIRSLKEVVDRARAGKVQYGSPGFGTTPQLSAEYLFKSLAKVDILHVPYKGIPPVIAAAISGEVDVASTALPPAVPHIKAGRLIGLAVTSGSRNAAIPDVPTIAEAGFTGFEDESWGGVWLPVGTSAAVTARLRDELDRAVASPDLQERLRNIGFEANNLRGDAFGGMVRRELDKWQRVVKETGAKVE